MSPEDKEKLFLPYFSTKGRGTGLGLAIVNHILSDHGAPFAWKTTARRRAILRGYPMAAHAVGCGEAEARA